MAGAIKTVTSAALAFAVAALPVVLNHCATTCERHQNAATAPACHHASVSGSHLAAPPGACGHDHGDVVVTAAKAARTTGQPDVDVIADLHTAPIADSAVAARRLDTTPSPPCSSSLAAGSAPLRI